MQRRVMILCVSNLFVDAIRVDSSVDADALDETNLRRLVGINTVEVFSEVVTDLPYNAKVFISSRAQPVMLDYLRPLIDNPRVRHIHLSTDSRIPLTRFRSLSKRLK